MRAWILLGASSIAWAQPQPDVENIFERVASTYAHLTDYHFKFSQWPRDQNGHTVFVDFAAAKPGKFYLRDPRRGYCVTDGHLTWRYLFGTTRYSEATASPFDPTAPAPEIPRSPVAGAGADCERQMVNARILFVDRWTQAPQWSRRAKLVREGSFGVSGSKRRCWVIDIDPVKGVHFELWIDQSTFLVLRERYRNKPDKEKTSRDWLIAEIAQPPDPALFQFKPAKGLIKDREPGAGLIGKPAPDFKFIDATGTETSLSSLKGHIVVLCFWATWTPGAMPRMKGVNAAWHSHQQDGVVVIGVSYVGKNESQKDVDTFLKKNKIDFPNYVDSSVAVHAAYLADRLPTTVVIDAEGKIRQHLRNDDSPSHWQIDAMLGLP